MTETPRPALATLRILVGMFFMLFGEYEGFGTDFTLWRVRREYRGFFVRSVYPWMKPARENIILPHARSFETLSGKVSNQ
jgi:hypothetical protein